MKIKHIETTYKISDPRDLPTYSIAEAAHYLGIPKATVRSWARGRYYPTEKGPKRFEPIITLPDESISSLSFINMVEVHVLDAIRRVHKIPLNRVRDALQYVQSRFSTEHPLADQIFETDGVDLFLSKFGTFINITKSGQLAIRNLLSAHLERVEHDKSGLASKLYPFIRKKEPDEPKTVVIDPRVAFGRPMIAGTGIATSVMAERYKAGESIDELANDYDCKRFQVEEAIRCELDLAA